MTTELKPTDDQIATACLSYRADFGLLDVSEQSKVKYAGLEWLLAWQKAMPEMGNTQAAIAAAMMRAVKHILEMPDIQDYDEFGRAGFASPPQWQVAAEIEELIPTDATAALEEAKRKVWNEALEQAAQIVDPAPNAKSGRWAENIRRKSAAIRAMKKEKP
jgi:hypothetical protein